MQVSDLLVRRLGLVEYEPVWRAMQSFTNQRDANTPDELWPGDIPVIQVDRGGQVTYHGPGQIVAYPLIDIKRLKMGVRELVTGIERAIIIVLKSYSVDAQPVAGAPGVYVDGVKIASLGLRIRRGRSFHGLAFNINMDLEPFQRINPCGFEGLQVTNLSAFTEVSMAEVEDRLIKGLCQVLGYNHRFRMVEGILPFDERNAG